MFLRPTNGPVLLKHPALILIMKKMLLNDLSNWQDWRKFISANPAYLATTLLQTLLLLRRAPVCAVLLRCIGGFGGGLGVFPFLLPARGLWRRSGQSIHPVRSGRVWSSRFCQDRFFRGETQWSGICKR